MASMITNESNEDYEKWLHDKLKSLDEVEADVSMLTNYIMSTLTEEETSDDEKRESIIPFLQELNQNGSFDENQLVNEIINSWNQMKTNEKLLGGQKIKNSQEPTPTDTILSMINKHKSQLVEVKKHNESNHQNDNLAVEYDDDSSEEDGDELAKEDNVFTNTNMQDAQAREKANRDKLVEAYTKQKEQTKKAQIEQKQKEIEKKKKAQQKVAKVERKR